MHELAPTREKRPAGQGAMAVAPLNSQKKPALHTVQSGSAVSGRYEPGAHCVHALCPTTLKRPAPHTSGHPAVLLALPLAEPAAQMAGTDVPLGHENPGGHAAHAVGAPAGCG
jgi:hypothetical protein